MKQTLTQPGKENIDISNTNGIETLVTQMEFEAFVADPDRVEYDKKSKVHYSKYCDDWIGPLPYFLDFAKKRGIHIQLDAQPKITDVLIPLQDLSDIWAKDVSPKLIGWRIQTGKEDQPSYLKGNLFVGTDRNMAFQESYKVPILRSIIAEINGPRESCLVLLKDFENALRESYNCSRPSHSIYSSSFITLTRDFGSRWIKNEKLR